MAIVVDAYLLENCFIAQCNYFYAELGMFTSHFGQMCFLLFNFVLQPIVRLLELPDVLLKLGVSLWNGGGKHFCDKGAQFCNLCFHRLTGRETPVLSRRRRNQV